MTGARTALVVGAPLGVEESVRGIVDVLEARAGTARHGFVDYRGREAAWQVSSEPGLAA